MQSQLAVSHAYRNVRTAIRNGDALLFENDGSLAGTAISWWTRSPYIHVGMAYWLQTPGGVERLFVLEAKEYYGVRLYLVSDYLARGRKIRWFKATATDLQRQQMTDFALSKLGHDYIRYEQLVWGFLRLGRPRKPPTYKGAQQDWASTWFCSELYGAAAHGAGLILPCDKLASEMDPADVPEILLPTGGYFLRDQGLVRKAA